MHRFTLLLILVFVSTVYGTVVVEHGLNGLTLRLRSMGASRHVLHQRMDRTVWVHSDKPGDAYFVRSSIFRIMPGLTGYGTVSFESVHKQGFYLHPATNFLVEMNPMQRSDHYRKVASFIVHTGLAGKNGVSFESVRYPAFYLRRASGRVVLSRRVRFRRFRIDATWRLESAMKIT